MKNNTNIYDIDGDLIRPAGDTHKMTIEEAQKRMEHYRKKLSEIKETDKKAIYYATYMRNLSNYLMQQYMSMPQDKLQQLIDKHNTEESIKKAMEELQEEVDNTPSDTVMDEYVDFEEIPAQNEDNTEQNNPV